MVHRIVTVDLCACIMHLKHPKLYITSFIVPLCEHLKGCQLQIRHFQNHCFKLRGYPDYRFGHQKFNQSSGRDVKWSVFVFHDLQQPDFWTCRKNKWWLVENPRNKGRPLTQIHHYPPRGQFPAITDFIAGSKWTGYTFLASRRELCQRWLLTVARNLV